LGNIAHHDAMRLKPQAFWVDLSNLVLQRAPGE
jgi:hypothetical protein